MDLILNRVAHCNIIYLQYLSRQLLSSESVREACATKLLQAWLRIFDGNVLDLLRCLDVENSTDDTAELTLKVVFNKVPPAELVDNFDLLNEKYVLLCFEGFC